jgi:transposase
MTKDVKDKYIKQLEDKIALLEARIKELERMLGINSQNSSKPPSSDGPEVLKPRTRGKIRRKRGARKGHPPHLRKLFPPEEVTKFIPHEPLACTCGGEDLEECDEESLRHQTVDIPEIKPIVIEHVQYVRRCRKCGALVYTPLPDAVRRNIFGPGVLALVGVLTGMLNTSKRKALAVINEVFQVPMSLGGLSNCEAQLTQALEQPYQEAAEHVRKQDIGHADETGWPRGNRKKGWLWTLGCATAVFFMVQARRSQKAARQLIGSFSGKLVSDRYNAYNFYQFIRQICWAHLKRDFKALSEAGGKLGKIGLELHQLARQILKMRARVRDGTLLWKTFQHRMPKLQKQVESRLQAGAQFNGKLGGKCRDILKQKKYLWTFVADQAVEPTNNFAERIVRQGVLWRKTSFGTQSERGARYVERILTACATCHLQGRGIIKYLRHACHCHLDGIRVPSLIKTSGCLAKTA